MPAGPRKSDFLYAIFCLIVISHSSVYHFRKKKKTKQKNKNKQTKTNKQTNKQTEKPPILTKLGALYNNLPKIHPIYVIGLFQLWWKSPDRYTKYREKAPQKAGTYTYSMSIWDPPGTNPWDGESDSLMTNTLKIHSFSIDKLKQKSTASIVTDDAIPQTMSCVHKPFLRISITIVWPWWTHSFDQV